MPAPLVWLAWTAAVAGVGYLSTTAPQLAETADDFEFPNEQALNPPDAPEYTHRELNPLWAPTAYLQAIDCDKSAYKVRTLDGEIKTFREYQGIPADIQAAADESSFGYAVHVNDEGHALFILKADGYGVPVANEGDSFKDFTQQEEQTSALDKVMRTLLDDPDIQTIEAVGFAQGTGKVYYLTENYNVLGTNVSNSGTDFTSEHLDRYVVWLDTPGDIHSIPYVSATGEHMPGIEIDVGSALNTSLALTPLSQSFAENVQTMAFTFDEAQAPEGYEGHGVVPLDNLGVDFDGVHACENPTLPQIFTPSGGKP